MSRVPAEELERLKREVPVAGLCEKYGVELKRHGSNDLIGCCPFHEDRTPSFVVTPSKNLWHCLGACGCGGDNVQLIMKKEGVSFRHAVEKLRAMLGDTPVMTSRSGKEHAVLIEPGVELDDAGLLGHVVEYYHQTFLNEPAAMQYLQKRNCFHPEAVKRFKLGYANRTLGYRVPDTTMQGRKLKEQLQRVGLFRGSGHEHLSGCVVLPVFKNGNVSELYGRRITTPSREAPAHWYLPGPHAGVWNADELQSAKEWHLCEAGLDALTLWCHGMRNVTWSYGVNGFTPDHWSLLKTVKPDRVWLWQDNDEAGNAAAHALAQQLEPLGVETWRIELPANRDVNDVVRLIGAEAPGQLASLLAGGKRLLTSNGVGFLPPPSPSEPAQEPEPADTPAMKSTGDMVEMSFGERHWQVRGLEKNTSFEVLKVHVRVRAGGKFYMDTFDLYQARARSGFVSGAAAVSATPKESIESDLNALIMRLEEVQQKAISAVMEPVVNAPVMTGEEEAKALALLREPKLFERILADFVTAGNVGEESNKLLGYLIAISRKLDDPLSGLIVSRSAAGKSALMGAILDFVPEEDKQVVTSMTTQALYYLPDDGLKHKVLAVVEDEGSENASYPLKILQSEKKLILAVTVKDSEGGMPKTELKTVEGPVAQFMTSTQAEFDEELANRYLVLSVDENREQTRRIHAAQREAETLQGWMRQMDRAEVIKTHHNAQRLLRMLRVVNPFAGQLSFPDDQLRLRRDHKKYLGLIRTIAFMRQYQKPVKSCEHRGEVRQYIEVDETDLQLANQLAVEVLGRSLDELAPATRAFLLALHELVECGAKAQKLTHEKVRFNQRQLRESLKWSDTQVRRHLDRLTSLEYVIEHRMPGTGSRYLYELLYDGEGKAGGRFVLGLRP